MQNSIFINHRGNEHHQYKLIFEALYPVMCHYARKFVFEQDSAEDIAQEVFIELWKQRSRFESYDQMKAFLYLSIKNKCLNQIKHQQVEDRYVKEILQSKTETDDQYILEAEIINNLINTIECLPGQQKKVIVCCLQGMTNEEIADALQISFNTVKHHKKAAYQALRTRIKSSFLSLIFI